jgi:hypothetical protein
MRPLIGLASGLFSFADALLTITTDTMVRSANVLELNQQTYWF